MATIIFDSKNKKEYFSKYDINFLTFESIKEFNCYGQHETLISIISNAQKIADEIDSIIDKIIKEYPNTTHFIFFDTSILNSFLFLFDNLDSKIGNYAETEFKEIESLMNKTNEFISKNKQEIEEYEYALKNSIVVEEDKYLFIVNIEDKFHNTFPKHIFNIYKRMEKLEPYKTREEKEIMEKENKIYYEYILNTYSKEYKKFASDVVKNYLEEIKERQKFLNGELKYFKQYKKDIKTCYFDSFLSFLRRIKNIVLYIEYQVKALNCIEYENETFNWGNITKEERLCLANIYANPLKVDIELPKSKILYAIKENENITPLIEYACTSLKTNKGKPYLNIMHDFLKKNLIELQQYECSNILEIINVLFYQYKISNVQINKCLNCGKYFIPKKKSNEKYCDNVSPQNINKTCKEFGVNKTYREEIKSIPIKSEHNRISQTYRMRIKRAKNEIEKLQQEKAFENYKKTYQDKKAKYNNRHIKRK